MRRAGNPVGRSRRGRSSRSDDDPARVIIGAAAGLAGLVADSVISTEPAGAASGDTVLLGNSNSSSATTEITTTSGDGLQGSTSDNYSYGVYGENTGVNGTGAGVYGTGNTYGVYGSGGTDGIGVYGSGGTFGVFAIGGTYGVNGQGPTGVYGYSYTGGIGVEGTATGGGVGVFGTAHTGVSGESKTPGGHGTKGQGTNGATGVYGVSDKGTGVLAKSTSGDALQVVGKVAFSRSGVSTVAAKKKSLKVTLAGVTTSSMILATLQSDAGEVAVANAVPGSGSFTINLTAAHPSPVKVAWFVLR